MMTLTSAALGTYARALEICEPDCAHMPGRLFIMLEAHGPQGATRHAVTTLEPSR
jgi:hypothetical protein